MTDSQGQQTSGTIVDPPEKNSEHNKSQATAPTAKREYKETIRLFIKMLVLSIYCFSLLE
jgi:hypothetical protein